MAYPVRQRDPLLEEHMQVAIRRRGSELIGLGLFAVGVIFALMLWSYSPDDPNRFNITSEPVKNTLGELGAAISSTLILTVGKAAWIIPLCAFVWAVRFILHIGERRAIGRIIFLPIFAAITAVLCAAHIPAEDWTHSFGLGGLFGDMALGLLIDLNPLALSSGLLVVTLIVGLVFTVFGLFVLGFTLQETGRICRFGLVGIILSYANIAGMFSSASNRLHTQSSRLFNRAEPKTFSIHAPTGPSENEAFSETNYDEGPALDEPKLENPMPRMTQKVVSPPVLPAQNLSHDDYDDETESEGSFEAPPIAPLAAPKMANPKKDRISSRVSEIIKTKKSNKFFSLRPSLRIEPVLTEQPTPTEPLLTEQNPAPQVLHTEEPPILEENSSDEGEFDLETSVENIFVVKSDTPKQVVQHAPQQTVRPSKQAQAEAQPSLFKAPKKAAEYEMPPLGLLATPTKVVRHHLSDEALEQNAKLLETVLDDYGVKGEIVSVRPGPVVTMYELEPAPGLKASRVIGLADDIARSMSALSARVSTVPGRSVVGIELPNENRETVFLRELLSGKDYGDGNHALPLALGKDIGGQPIIANLAKMPHLLIAGTTGSGKSVAINTMILSLLYKLSPDECRMIMIDPKMLELSVYDGIPHLLSPVVTDPKKAVVALKWVVAEMEERYRKMSKMGVRNVGGYNARVEEALSKGESFERTVQTGFDDETGEPVFETETFAPEKMPFIVVIVDEMADLMMVAGKEIEACIQRLAQMARASGIHLIMATQRPSVDVITGTVKANFPTRISFQVTSKIDSRTILGEMGAEQLLGMGDMLYMEGGGKITRVHGPFASDEEVEEVVNHLKSFGTPEYVGGIVDGPDGDKENDIDLVLGLGGNTDKEDALYDQAVAIVAKDRKCSTSYIQRKLAIGYNKAAGLVEQMEEQGIISAANHVGKRDILLPE